MNFIKNIQYYILTDRNRSFGTVLLLTHNLKLQKQVDFVFYFKSDYIVYFEQVSQTYLYRILTVFKV